MFSALSLSQSPPGHVFGVFGQTTWPCDPLRSLHGDAWTSGLSLPCGISVIQEIWRAERFDGNPRRREEITSDAWPSIRV